jgi:hypothetical protein
MRCYNNSFIPGLNSIIVKVNNSENKSNSPFSVAISNIMNQRTTGFTLFLFETFIDNQNKILNGSADVNIGNPNILNATFSTDEYYAALFAGKPESYYEETKKVYV